MAQRSPTLEGFRAVFRYPAFGLAEITWRWSFGAAACSLIVLTLIEYLDTLPVTGSDLFFLRSKQLFLITRAIDHILAGSAQRVVAATLVLVPALMVFWIVAASVGRASTVQSLLDYFRPATDVTPFRLRFWRGGEQRWRLRSLLGLNFLRVALGLAAVVGVLGAAILAGFVSSDSDPRPGLVFLVFVPLALLVALLWSAVNWFLSLAPVFVIHGRQDALGSVALAVDFCRQCPAAVLWSSAAFGMLHFVVFVLAISVAFLPLAFATVLPPAIVLGAIVLLTMVYFAIIDFLYMGRLAAYVSILHTAEETPAVSSQPSALSPRPTASSRLLVLGSQPATGDLLPIPPSDDDILSDVPGLIPSPEKPEH
ncbi:MAG TPA: hypothetical protein VEV41_12575 [Terriglobales bacterium]|nr:hypothetical protein [Terriglobales bacterium]